MASKGKTKDNAEEFLKTGATPEVAVEVEEDALDDQLDTLAAEQEQAEETSEDAEATEEDKAPPVPKKGEAKKPEAAETDEEAEADDADGNVADPDPNVLPEEVAALPRVQELLKIEENLNILKDALTEGYSIPSDLPFEKVVEQVRLERSDAHMLYQIIDQTLPASAFLTNLEKGFNQKDVVEPIYVNIAEHLGRNGFLEAWIGSKGLKLVASDAAATPGVKPTSLQEAVNSSAKIDPAMKPLMDEINKLREQVLGKGQTVSNGQLTAEDQKNENAYEGEIKRLMGEKKVSDEFFQDYKAAITDMVTKYPGGSRAVKERIMKGNFVDVRRFFANYNNAQLERAKKYVKGPASAAKPVVKKPGIATTPVKSKKPVAPPSKQDRIGAGLQTLLGKK